MLSSGLTKRDFSEVNGLKVTLEDEEELVAPEEINTSSVDSPLKKFKCRRIRNRSPITTCRCFIKKGSFQAEETRTCSGVNNRKDSKQLSI